MSEILSFPASPELTLALVAITLVVSMARVPEVVIGPPVIPDPLFVPTEVTVPPPRVVSATDI